MSNAAAWGRMHELRPDQLEQMMDSAPVAYWPLGLIEHHGWPLPVGYDGIKAERMCMQMIERTGGVLFPVMWWGGGGGHGHFKWTFYQPLEIARQALATTVEQLLTFGFKCVVVVAGHYPWRGIMQEVLVPIQAANPERRIIFGCETELGPPGERVPGDHAARWETAYGLSLLPEFIDMSAMEAKRDTSRVWPPAGPQVEPDSNGKLPVHSDAEHPLFAQYGEDSHLANKEEADAILKGVVDNVTMQVKEALGGTPSQK